MDKNNKKNFDTKKIKIVVACDKYKGSLKAIEVCSIIKKAINDINKNVNVVLNPMADGGEGTVDTLVESYGGKYIDVYVLNPLGEEIKSYFGLIENGNTAVIEMSLASGLALIPKEKRNPLITTTYGTGQLILKAIELGCKKIIIGIGGSATNDAGIGALQALGVKFYDKNGLEVGFGGAELIKINKIDVNNLDQRIRNIEIFVACDVNNSLYGVNGAAYVYAPQKGADKEMVKFLDKGLRNFSEIVKIYLNKDVANLKGSGAAGGLGAGLVAFLDAKLKPGADLIIEATGLENKIIDADLIVTGEGSVDNQTFYGKSAFGVARTGLKYNIPVITINGCINLDDKNIKIDNKSNTNYFTAHFDIIKKPLTLNEAIENAKDNLYFTATQIFKFYFSCINYK